MLPLVLAFFCKFKFFFKKFFERMFVIGLVNSTFHKSLANQTELATCMEWLDLSNNIEPDFNIFN